MNIDAIGNPIQESPAANVICEVVNCCVVAYDSRGMCVGSLRCAVVDVDPSVRLMGWAGYVEVDPESDHFKNPSAYRVELGVLPSLVERDPMPVTLNGHVLKGVPDGGTVTIEGIQYPTDGTDITLQFGRPGTYVVKCEGFPYTPVEVEVVYGN